MATISTTLTLIDQMSDSLKSIHSAVDSVKESLDGMNTGASDAQDAIDGFSWANFLTGLEDAGTKIASAGEKMTLAVTAPLTIFGKKLYNASTEHETAFVGMQKTVEGTAEEYEHLNEVAHELSEITPVSYTELMGIAQTGGNVGVAMDEMEGFMKGFAMLQYASDQHISGDAGVQLVADFLNITEGGVQNIDRFGSSIIDLGNHFNATEDQILGLGKRMASAAHLAGFATPEILGMATAIRSVGINEEAGGSAASKLIKQFQLAAEVGGNAQRKLSGAGVSFASGMEFSNYLDSLSKADLVGLAESLEMTTDAVQSMADSWLLLDQFAEVSGKTSQQFVEDWSKNPATAMEEFFYGLSALGENGAESILATLDKMGITEIRESNLVAALASRPELLASAIQTAIDAYTANTAMMEEFNKQTSTQEAQNTMLGNKLNNSMADLGDNVVRAVQPILDAVNGLLDAFNGLSEVDQDRIVMLLEGLVLGGPSLMAIGKLASGVGRLGTGILKIKDAGGVPAILDKVKNFLLTPAGGVLLLAGAVAGVAAAIHSIPTDAEQIWEGLKDIQITVDDESVNETLAAIQKVKDAADQLKNPEISAEYENTSSAVALGYGTSTMYGSALGYEANKANAGIDATIAEYSGKLRGIEDKIANATTEAERSEYFGQYQVMEAAMNDEVANKRALYAEKISELFNGMAAQYPEAKAALESASEQYDLLAGMEYLNSFEPFFPEDLDAYGKLTGEQQQAMEEAYYAPYRAMQEKVLRGLAGQGYLGMSYDEAAKMLENGTPWMAMIYGLEKQVMDDLNRNVQTVSDNPLLAGFLKSIISDESILQNLDFTALNGALDGMIEALDFKNAFEQAAANGNVNTFGQYLVQGLADGVTANAGLIEPPFTTVRDSALTALQNAFQMHSPSVVMQNQGIFIPQGLAAGILAGSGAVNSAMATLGNSAVAVLRSILTREVGQSIANQIVNGMVSGLLSGAPRVNAAARAMGNAAASGTRGALEIHSPSRVFAEIADMSAQGYIEGAEKASGRVQRAMNQIMRAGEDALDGGVRPVIGSFAGLENQKFLAGEDDSDAKKLSDSDMEKIRQLAEREVINQFTTAELHVNFTANNKIESNLDLDGVVTYLEDKVTERLEMVAEGVHD